MTSNRKRITLRLNLELNNKLQKESNSLGISKNAFIVMILNNALNIANDKEIST